jgi:di- and tripeptidase
MNLFDGPEGSERHVPIAGRLFFGCQDCSILWIDIPSKSFVVPSSEGIESPSSENDSLIRPDSPSSSGISLRKKRMAPHKFFDSLSSGERLKASIKSLSMTDVANLKNSHNGWKDGLHSDEESSSDGAGGDNVVEVEVDFHLSVPPSNIVSYAHFGYIYSLIITPCTSYSNSSQSKGEDGQTLISAGGDGDIKVWNIGRNGLELVTKLEGKGEAALCLEARDGTLIAGYQEGVIRVSGFNL